MRSIPVLIAEDVEVMRRLLKNSLIIYNCKVIAEIDNGNDIIDAVKEHNPQIIFLDINLPGKNGLDALQEIRAFDQDTFIAMVSGHSSFENVKAALEYGANGFVVKPFTSIKIKEMIDKYHTLKEDGESAGSVGG